MKVLQSALFAKTIKKMHPNQKKDIDSAVEKIIENPFIGTEKKGVLKNVFVYKFSMQNQLTLLAYIPPEKDTIILLSIGSHENFYRTLENYTTSTVKSKTV